MENQAVKEFRSIALKWGIISGLVSILYTILLYVIDAKLLASGTWTSLSMVFIITFIVLSVKEFKLTQEGYLELFVIQNQKIISQGSTEANFGEVELDELHGHPNVPLNFGGQTGHA